MNPASARPPVALLTDFGPTVYAGIMKGVILQHAPDAVLVDVSHQVPPHHVRQGAWLLSAAVPWFPEGTIFVAVIDPGVGTRRQAVAAAAGGCRFVGPDNGVLWPAVESLGGPEAVVRLEPPAGASTTFHGRDVFAPAAGRLAAGTPLPDLGPPTRLEETLSFYRQGRSGEVVQRDRFGNLVTNLPPQADHSATGDPLRYRLSWEGGSRTLPLLPTYGAGAILGGSSPFLVVGSAATLEISCHQAAAAEVLPLAPGDRVLLELV